jgi:hypothetical protein
MSNVGDAVLSGTRGAGEEARWTPARVFMLLSALYHLPLGVAGLVVNQAFPIGTAAAERAGSGQIFGTFETNGWHSVAALALGVISVYYLVRPARAREAALAIGVFHIGITLSLFLWPPETFWLASNSADQVIHTFTAIAGIGSALLTPKPVRA